MISLNQSLRLLEARLISFDLVTYGAIFQCRLIIRMNIICQTQAACRVVPKDLVENIDAFYKDNELTATEYIDDIYKYYKLSEVMFYALTKHRT
jgi:hypothetical protein